MKTVKYIYIVFLLYSVVACEKNFLERPPEDALTPETFYQNDDEVEASTAALYNVAWYNFNFNSSVSMGDMRCGNMISNDRYWFYQFQVRSDRFELLRAWRSLYVVIAHANTVLKTLKDIDNLEVSEEAIIRGMAECRFHRATAYSNLVLNWGPVPIIYDNELQLSDTSIPPNTEESIWEFIIKDLTYAKDNLPETWDPGRVTKWSAEGMLSKMYLYKSGLGSDNGMRDQSDLDSAAYYAGNVCKNSGLNLMPNYADLFLTKNDNNEESLFALQWVVVPDVWGTANTFQAFYAKEPSITGTGDGWGDAHGASADILKYYVNHPEDSIRRKATFMFPGDVYEEISATDSGYWYTDSTIANVKKYIVGTPEDNDGVGEIMRTENNTYMLRLAEVYLIYAEAILGNDAVTSDPDALFYFQAIKDRAGLDTVYTEINYDDIMFEKRIELAMEANYWMELIKWYYFDPEAALNYINTQDKGYYYVKNLGVVEGMTQYALELPDTNTDGSDVIRYYTCTPENIFYPIPESEMVQSPNLNKDPEPFDFSLLEE